MYEQLRRMAYRDSVKRRLRKRSWKKAVAILIIGTCVFGILGVFILTDYQPADVTNILLCYMIIVVWNLAIPLDEWTYMRNFEKKLADSLPAEFQPESAPLDSCHGKILAIQKYEHYGYWVSFEKDYGDHEKINVPFSMECGAQLHVGDQGVLTCTDRESYSFFPSCETQEEGAEQKKTLLSPLRNMLVRYKAELIYAMLFLLVPPVSIMGASYCRYWIDSRGVLAAQNSEKNEEGIKWNYDAKTKILTINGAGEMPDFTSSDYGEVPWEDFEKEIKKVVVSDGITYIGARSFSCLTNLKEAELPDTLERIGTYAFSDTHLTEISLPESLTEIGYKAFASCGFLRKVLLPENLTVIGEGAFMNCDWLMELDIPENIQEIGDKAFYGCKRLADEDGFLIQNHVLYGYYGNEKELTVPEGVQLVDERAFSESSVSSVTLPAGVTEIGADAFSNCSNLEQIILPESLKTIGIYAFENCEKLEQFTWPESLESIGSYAFENCVGIKEAVLPDGVTKIGSYAFTGCTSLKQIGLPASLTEIGTGAFENDSALTVVMLDPQINCTIYEDTFAGCPGILDQNGYAISEGILYAYYGTETDLVIPEGVTIIGNSAFYLKKDIQTVVLPDSVTKIGNYAFFGNIALTEINIPDQVTEIGESAFTGCYVLQEISLGKNTRTIGNYAFQNSGLTSFTFVDGTEEIPDNCFYQCTGLTSVEIPETVRKIGSRAFFLCDALQEIHLPEELTEIGKLAFVYDESLTSVTIPDGVTVIQPGTFAYCTNLKEVKLGANTVSIGSESFKGDTAIKTIILPESVTEVAEDAFEGCADHIVYVEE